MLKRKLNMLIIRSLIVNIGGEWTENSQPQPNLVLVVYLRKMLTVCYCIISDNIEPHGTVQVLYTHWFACELAAYSLPGILNIICLSSIGS